MCDQLRELLHGLIKILSQSRDPFLLTAELMAQLLHEAEARYHEVGGLLVDMVMLARLEKQSLPGPELTSLRRSVHELGNLREDLQLDRLLSIDTRQECGRYAIPALALALYQVWSRLAVFDTWLEGLDEFRVQLDARLHWWARGRPDPE